MQTVGGGSLLASRSGDGNDSNASASSGDEYLRNIIVLCSHPAKAISNLFSKIGGGLVSMRKKIGRLYTVPDCYRKMM